MYQVLISTYHVSAWSEIGYPIRFEQDVLSEKVMYPLHYILNNVIDNYSNYVTFAANLLVR